jgi:mono/diheme cytochrome c family protein
MDRKAVLALCAVILGLSGRGAASAGDLAAEVRSVFAAKCAACHGPDLAKPKGRFGYVLDLSRLAGNRELVVPTAPEESELWELVRRGEMPPEDSPAGTLSQQQKEVIRAWIAAGAPAAADGETKTSPVATSDTLDSSSSATRFLRRLGRLHILVIHFPIALLIAAAGAEV